MPDPAELLAVARLLCGTGPATDAQLRRAVSTAYYAVFHKVAEAAAQRFVGAAVGSSGAYALLYRAFEHTHMRQTCDALCGSTLAPRHRAALGRPAVSQDVRDFAGAFAELQVARHQADYDPTAAFAVSDAASLVDAAEVAMQAFDRIAPDEGTDLLALLMVRVRG